MPIRMQRLPKSGKLSLRTIWDKIYNLNRLNGDFRTLPENGLGSKSFRELAGIPTGPIRISDFYGKPDHYWGYVKGGTFSLESQGKTSMEILKEFVNFINSTVYTPKFGKYWDFTNDFLNHTNSDNDRINGGGRSCFIIKEGECRVLLRDVNIRGNTNHRPGYKPNDDCDIGYEIYVWE